MIVIKMIKRIKTVQKKNLIEGLGQEIEIEIEIDQEVKIGKEIIEVIKMKNMINKLEIKNTMNKIGDLEIDL